MLNRRTFMLSSAALSVLATTRGALAAPGDPPAQPFNAGSVRGMARDLASKPFRPPATALPENLQKITYDRYRAIRFLPERALWRDEKLPFQVQFFHRGFLFSNRVDIFEVAGGVAKPVSYSPSLFSFGETPPPAADADLGFSGFRLHYPLNTPDYHDEICVFVGASYFRAVAKGQVYGLSARGLAINTGQAKGEEFPVFKSFWIEKPAQRANSIVVHALLDSQSTTAAYRFTIRPGETTVFDTEMAIYPRVELSYAGLAPMTSMFFFGPNDRNDIEDFRPSVHDSDGLAINNGRGERLWRPLSNPRDLQASGFADTNPQGFGLVQRERNFAAFQDLESRFEKRPSLWAEPIGDWGEGSLQLLEIPTKEEVHDNIAAFWTPKGPLQAKAEHTFTYRLHWGAGRPPELATFRRTAIAARGADYKLFVLDFAGGRLKEANAADIKGLVTAEKADIRNVVTQPNPETGGWRLSFEVATGDTPVELRAVVNEGDKPLTEVWMYRWAP
jgi:periplasmic glucans biosynthesis protein